MYKVFDKDRLISFSESSKKIKIKDNRLIIKVIDGKEAFQCYIVTRNCSCTNDISFFSDTMDDKTLFNEFRACFIEMPAAGGVVTNPNNKLLMIFRNGYWDLPKGKIEDGESIKDAAVREVEEECHISGLEITNKAYSTYHVYQLNGQEIFKETHWFPMKTKSSQQLKPQTEEGITQVGFFNQEEVKKHLDNTFPLIKMLVEYLTADKK